MVSHDASKVRVYGEGVKPYLGKALIGLPGGVR